MANGSQNTSTESGSVGAADAAGGQQGLDMGSDSGYDSYNDTLADDLLSLLTEDGDPTVRESDSMLEVKKAKEGGADDGSGHDGDVGDFEEAGEEGGDEGRQDGASSEDGVSDGDGGGDPDGDTDDTDDTEDDAGDESDEDEAEHGTDENEPKPGSRANERIRKLVAEKNEIERKLAEAEARAQEAERLASTSTEEHPDPENEVKELREKYKRVMTPQEIVSSNMVNPLTGSPYTPAEAQAAVAELKQDIQFQIDEANNAVVERMNQAREAEALANSLVAPLQELINDFPQLDPGSPKADKDLCNLLQTTIDANSIQNRGLLTGFVKQPEEFIGAFRRVLKSQGEMRANKVRKTDAKVDTLPKHGALDSKRTGGKMEPTDELLSMFDDAMKEIGY